MTRLQKEKDFFLFSLRGGELCLNFLDVRVLKILRKNITVFINRTAPATPGVFIIKCCTLSAQHFNMPFTNNNIYKNNRTLLDASYLVTNCT